jgi:very-short-patch-repair endonuclease
MIITQTATTKMGGKNIKHYKKLGYKVKLFETITVPIDQLPPGSHYIIDVKCDYCGNIIKKVYKSLLNERRDSIIKKDCCCHCIGDKDRETNLFLYGVENSMHREEVKKKMRDSNMRIYGYPYSSMDKNIRKKMSDSQKNHTPEKKINKREKTRKTVFERYGVISPLQLPHIRQRLAETQQKGSSQQDAVYELLLKKYGEENVKKNYPFSTLSLDVYLFKNNKQIDVEYDSCYWHNKDRDRRRDEFLKSKGIKVLRIKSKKLIPDENILFEKIENLIDTDYLYAEIVLEDWDIELYKEVR